MVLPALIIVLAIAFYPVMYGIVLSLTGSTVTAFSSFAGVENYVEAFQNLDFLEGLTNTLISTVVSVSLELMIGLAIALA